MNPAAAGVGGKRPAPSGGDYVPRKRPAGDDDDVMEEDFDLEPPEDDLEEYVPEEVRRAVRAPLPGGARRASTRIGLCRLGGEARRRHFHCAPRATQL